MRQDVYIQNDSGAWSVLSYSVLDRVIADARGNDGQFVEAHQAVLNLLVGDDSFIARVVVGEPLSTDEQDQWVAHHRWALEVPCGRLLVAGGFDPDIFTWWREGQSHAAKAVGEVQVPPGKYLADVYTYLHSMNGRVILDDVWQEKLGTWFREDHPNRAFPGWVAGELAVFPEFDPGHEVEWKKLKQSVDQGTIKLEMEPVDMVSYLVHLQPFDPKSKLDEQEQGDWFGSAQGLRRPDRFPLGVASSTAQDPEYRGGLDPLYPPKPKEEVPLTYSDVISQVEDKAFTTVAGGPVEVPAAKAARAFRLAWFATGLAHPEMRLTGPGVTGLARHFGGELQTVVEGDALHVKFPDDGRRFGTLARFAAMSEPWNHVPAGTVLEVSMRPQSFGDPIEDPLIGLQRYKGAITVRGSDRVWEISESYPKVSADTLRGALEVSAAAEAEDRLALSSEDRAKKVEAFFTRHWKFILAPNKTMTRQGSALHIAPADNWTVAFVGLAGFRALYGDVWPVEKEKEEA